MPVNGTNKRFKKTDFIFHVKTLNELALAKEVFELQRQYNFPGLVQEGRVLLRKYELPNIIDEKLNLSKYSWTTLVKNNILKHSEEKLASDFLGYSKLCSESEPL